MSWKSWEQAAERGPMAVVWKVFWAVLALSIVIGVVGFVLNPFRQAARIADKTMDADNVIYNYEWFKQRYQDVRAVDAKIVSSRQSVAAFEQSAGPRKEWTREDRIEHSRLSSVLLGLRQQRNDLAADYNARSRMANRSIFKGGDLPDSIPIQE